MPSRPQRQGWGFDSGRVHGPRRTRYPVRRARRPLHPPRPPRRRRCLATLLVLFALLTHAAGARDRQARAEDTQPGAAATQPRELAASEVDLTEGILAFEEGRVPDAMELLTAAVSADPQSGTALHWLGLAQLRLGRAIEAVAALEAALAAGRPAEAERWRVTADLGAAQLAAGDLPAAVRTLSASLARRPEDPLTLWRYGTALQRSGQEEAGARALRKARELTATTPAPGPTQPPGTQEEPPVVAPPYPGSPLACAGSPPRWEGRLALEASYDSNPGLLPADATFLPLTGTRPAGTASGAGGDLDLRLENHPFYGRGGWSLGLGAAGHRSAYRNQGDLDLSLAGGFVQLAWGEDPRGYLAGPLGYTRVPEGEGRLGLLLQAASTWTRLGTADFLRLAGGAGSLTVRGPGSTATRIDLGATRLRFAGDLAGDLRRSGSELAAGVSESWFSGRHGGYLRAAASGGARQAGASFAYRFVEGTVEAGAPPVAGWTLSLQATRRQERFDHPQSSFTEPAGPPRSDAIWWASVAAVRMLGQHLACTARAAYIRRNSNVELPGLPPPFEYRRTTAGLGVTWFL
jgi:tetratricopeptide (TPR) repeat protein